MTNASQASKNDLGVYSIRWLLLAATFLCSVINVFLSKSFGTANQILSIYFDVTVAELDWALLGLYAGTTLVTPIFAYLCYANLIGFRNMSICGTACLFLSCMCIVLTVQFPVIFPLMIVISFLQGVAYCVSFSVGVYFAVLWFPDHQVAFAIACNTASWVAGSSLGSIIPPALLVSPLFQNGSNSSFLETPAQQEWLKATNTTLLWLYSVPSGMLCILFICFCVFAKDLPPKAPTFALHLKRISHQQKETPSVRKFIVKTKELFSDCTYVLSVFILGVTYNIIIVLTVHLPLLVGVIVDNDVTQSSTALISGYTRITYGLSAFVSSFAVAKILLHFKNYARLATIGTGIMLCGGLGLLSSYYFKNVIGFYISNVILGAGTRLGNVPLQDVITRHTYPKNERLVTVWMAGCVTGFAVLYTGLARLISDHTNAASSLILTNVCLLLCFTSTFFFKPQNNRGKFDKTMLIKDEYELSSQSAEFA